MNPAREMLETFVEELYYTVVRNEDEYDHAEVMPLAHGIALLSVAAHTWESDPVNAEELFHAVKHSNPDLSYFSGV